MRVITTMGRFSQLKDDGKGHLFPVEYEWRPLRTVVMVLVASVGQAHPLLR